MNRKSLSILKEIAGEVYSAVRPFLGSSEAKRIVGSGFGGDRTMFIDDLAEKAMIRYIERNDLACTVIAEERGILELGKNPKFYLIADAVDGTTNAVRGIDFASTSLAISPTDSLADLEAAVVMNLFDGGIYEAEKGKGARYNGKNIKPSRAAALEDCIMNIDVSRAPEMVGRVVPLMKAIEAVRGLGSAALEICYVASGLLDAYVDVRAKLRALDYAAGMLILREAGGVFCRLGGGGFDNVSLTELGRFSVIAAANEGIYAKIVSLISDL